MDYPRIDDFSSIESHLHNFDPRAKMVTFLIFVFSVAFINDLVFAAFALLFSLLLTFISKLPLSFVYRCLKYPSMFIFAIILIMAFTVEGRIIFKASYLNVTVEGIEIGLLIFLRATAALIISFLMLATTRFDDTIKALYMLKVPNILVQIITFSYRYIFVLIEEMLKLKRSMYCRGFHIKLNRYSLSVIGNMVGMLLIKSYDRGERVYRSMIARGYTGKPGLIIDFNMLPKDYYLSIVLITIAISLHVFPFWL